MSKFNFNEYQDVVNRAQAGSAQKNNAVKVGFFKLKNDGDEALVRINVSSLDELQFAAVHQLGANNRWMKVSCLSPIGAFDHSDCPLCQKVAEGDTSIGKAAKRVYVQLLVAYRDQNGQFSAEAQPVIWERPAGFSKEIAGLLRDYGDLKEHIFKVTRNGAAGSMQTTYTISYIPLYDRPEVVSKDFGAFVNFNIAKHSYWEKTKEEIETFLATGEFPEVEKKSDNLTTLENGIKVGGAPVFANAQEEAAFDAALNPNPFTAPAPKYDDAPAAEAPKAEEPVNSVSSARPSFKF